MPGSTNTLTGKIALITGGAMGIGRAMARLFADQGAGVAILDFDRDHGESVVNDIQADGRPSLFVHADVSNGQDCRAGVSRVRDHFGRIDILCNNAGTIVRKNILDLTESEWDHTMDVNLKSIFHMCKMVIPMMEKQGGGVIINTASGWGLKGGPRAVSYCASKGAVIQMTRAMAIDHAGQNIRVNCICPGDTDTDMLVSEAQQLGMQEAQFRQQASDRPLRRVGKPEDIAQAALYMASDGASFVTGTTLVVDGGGLAG